MVGMMRIVAKAFAIGLPSATGEKPQCRGRPGLHLPTD
jgi:hypothetical protein